MADIARISSIRFNVLAQAALAVVGMFLAVAVTSRYGAGISPDSVAYISSARNGIAGNGLATFDGEPLIAWPPAFPAALSVLGISGIDPLTSARFFNAALFGLIILFGSTLLRRHVGNRYLVVIGSGMMMLSEPLILVGTRAWSEPLFILLVVLFVLSMQDYLKTGRRGALVASATCAALAPLTRYVGVAVVLSGGIVLMLRRGIPPLRRLPLSISFVALASLPIAAWLLRNLHVSGSLTGSRIPSDVSLVRAGGWLIGALSEWFLPSILGIMGSRWLARRNPAPVLATNPLQDPRLAPAVFAVVYIVVIVASTISIGIDAIDHRLLSPVYVPLLFILLYWLDRRHGERPVVRVAGHVNWAVLVACLWLAWPCIDTGLRVKDYWLNGIPTFSTRAWHESALIAHLMEDPPKGTIYSNAPDAIYILAGLTAKFAPYKDEARTLPGSTRRLTAFKSTLNADSVAYLAWFSREDRPYLYSVEELSSFCTVDVVSQFPDGVLYRIRPLPTVH